MTKKDTTDITVILDRSGSMHRIVDDMKGAFDSFIEEQKKLPGECCVTLIQFDDEYNKIYTAKPISEIGKLELIPRGNTALLDAIGRAINETGERLKSIQESERPEHVLILIISDGKENASEEFGRDLILKMTEHQRDVYSWKFIYFGANQDAIQTAGSIGIPASCAATYEASGDGSKAVGASLNASVTSVRELGILPDVRGTYATAYNDTKSKKTT